MSGWSFLVIRLNSSSVTILHNLTKHRPIAVARHMWSSFATLSMDRFNLMELCGPFNCVIVYPTTSLWHGNVANKDLRLIGQTEFLITVQYIFHSSHDRICIYVRPFVQWYDDWVIQFRMTDNDAAKVLLTSLCLSQDVLEHLLHIF